MYLCRCMYVEGPICQVISLKSEVSWVQNISKNLRWGLLERFHFWKAKKCNGLWSRSLVMNVCMYIKSQTFTVSQNSWGWKGPLKICCPTTMLKARSPGPGCPGLCAVGFWRWMETPQLLCAMFFLYVREMSYWYSEIHRNFPMVTRVVTNLFKLFAHQ